MSIALYSTNPCPKCGAVKMRSVIEAHPDRDDLALHNFYCAECGPIKTEVLSLKPPARAATVAA
jgi:uncharacterized Zn finger protein